MIRPQTQMPNIAAVIFITLPWLNPFTFGPTPAVVPLLFSWLCTALLLLTWVIAKPLSPIEPNDSTVRVTVLAWVIAALLSAWIGLLQYFGATAGLGQWVNHTVVGEAFGNLRQRNQFASLLNIGLAALLWWAAQLPVLTTKNSAVSQQQLSWQVALVVTLAALFGMGNAASSSRTGLFQLMLVVGLTLFWQHRTKPSATRGAPHNAVRHALVASGLAYAIATLALPWLAGLDPLASGAWSRLRAGDAVCASRLTLWANVLHLIALKPWLGWGWGDLDYAHFMTLYPGARFCDILDNAHNLPLHIAVELGIPVAVLASGTGAWLVWRAKPWREADATRQLVWAVLAVILLHSLLEYPLWYGPFQMTAGLCVYFLWQKNNLTKPTLSPYWQASSAILIIAFCSYASLNYNRASQIYLPPEQRAIKYRDQTLERTREVRLYQDQVRFAELTITDLRPDNAQYMNELAKEMLHFSPEARVVEVIIDSALMLENLPEARFYQARYQAAFPQAYAIWVSKRFR